jgi:Ser/Thr protein kinase RdoA (MazF antagonist)
MEYTELDEDGQVAEVQKLVPGLLSQYGIEASSVENVNHSFNSSFKVTSTSGDEYALRINLGSGKKPDEVLAEMQWLEALAEDGSVSVQEPIRTTNDELLIGTPFAPLNTDTTAVLFKWIEGEEAGDEITDDQLFELGQNMAKLQIFAETLEFKSPASLPLINSTMMNSEDLLTKSQPEQINDKLYGDILKALAITNEVHTRLSAETKLLPIHADLHAWNVIVNNGKLAIIDFDDAGIGLPIQDLAISNYYIREDTEKEKHLKAGYASLKELPKISEADYEALLLSRLLVLINSVLDMTSAEIIEFLPTFMKRCQLRLDHYFATGQLLLTKESLD